MNSAATPKNRTTYKSLDRLQADKRVEKVWSEAESNDGLWVMLADGYNLDGCCVVHEYSAKDILKAMRRVKLGPTY